MHKIERVRLTEVNQHFWRLELLPRLIIEWKAKFQLEVHESRVVIFFPFQFMDPSLEIYQWTPH